MYLFTFIAGQPHMRLAGVSTQMNEFSGGMSGAGKMQLVLDGLKELSGFF
jgi:hypothetical protein